MHICISIWIELVQEEVMFPIFSLKPSMSPSYVYLVLNAMYLYMFDALYIYVLRCVPLRFTWPTRLSSPRHCWKGEYSEHGILIWRK